MVLSERERKLFKIGAAIVAAFSLVGMICLCAFIFGRVLPNKIRAEEARRQLLEYYDGKVLAFGEENKNYRDSEVDVVFLGDSLTDGYDLKVYYDGYIALNRGIGGDTSYGLEQRLEVSLYEVKPRVAVILIGGNNLDTMLDNYEDILNAFNENVPDTKIIVCSLTAMGGNFKEKNKIAAYNNVTLRKLAEKYEYEYVDLFYPLYNEKTGEIYAEYTSDGVHLTAHGYRVMTENISPIIEKLLGSDK